jgi:hypothetical protein
LFIVEQQLFQFSCCLVWFSFILRRPDFSHRLLTVSCLGFSVWSSAFRCLRRDVCGCQA